MALRKETIPKSDEKFLLTSFDFDLVRNTYSVSDDSKEGGVFFFLPRSCCRVGLEGSFF